MSGPSRFKDLAKLRRISVIVDMLSSAIWTISLRPFSGFKTRHLRDLHNPFTVGPSLLVENVDGPTSDCQVLLGFFWVGIRLGDLESPPLLLNPPLLKLLLKFGLELNFGTESRFRPLGVNVRPPLARCSFSC